MTPHAAALKKELDEKEARLKKEQRELDERREIFEAQRSSGAGLKLATQDVMERIKRATQNRDALTNDIEMVEIQIAAAEKKLKEKVFWRVVYICKTLTPPLATGAAARELAIADRATFGGRFGLNDEARRGSPGSAPTSPARDRIRGNCRRPLKCYVHNSLSPPFSNV